MRCRCSPPEFGRGTTDRMRWRTTSGGRSSLRSRIRRVRVAGRGVIEVGDRLAVGLLELAVERAAVLGREVDARLTGVARHLAQAAAGGLQDEVVPVLELTRECAGEQAGDVPAFGAAVDEQDDAMWRIGEAEAIEGGLLLVPGVMLEDQRRRQASTASSPRSPAEALRGRRSAGSTWPAWPARRRAGRRRRSPGRSPRRRGRRTASTLAVEVVRLDVAGRRP